MNVVVACYPEDVATEFLSVLDNSPDEPLLVVLAVAGATLALPRGSAAARLAELEPHVDALTPATAMVDAPRLASALRAAVDSGTVVWTHAPADVRGDRARVGWLTALSCTGSRVLHAIGMSVHYQFMSDVAVPLSISQVGLKLAFLATCASGLVSDERSPRHIGTEAVAACERFVRLSPAEADRIYALLHSMDDESSVTRDPWDFRCSEYERERLAQTARWVRRHVAPGGLLVEAGSCEGALTVRLLEDGHRIIASEPNHRFRERLVAAVQERAEVMACSLEQFADGGAVPAAAYLLIEMLYYVADLSILERLPTDLLFLAVNDEEMRARLQPWLAASSGWEFVERVELVTARIDFVCADRAYRRKEGSVGMLCARR